MKYIVLLACFFATVTASADAQICRAKDHMKVKMIFVAKPGKVNEFFTLAKAELLKDALSCCINCIIEPGTKILITDYGWATHSIRVLEGKAKGCIGEIPKEYAEGCQQ